MPYTNIDATVTDAQRTTVLASLNAAQGERPFLVNLTPQERQERSKMGTRLSPPPISTPACKPSPWR